MENKFVAKQSIELENKPAEVWKALTTPEEIKKYFFGTETISDWKIGSSIVFKGEWEGKEYEDKGTILELIPEKRLVYNYWSSFAGTDDIPENYATITYELTPQNSKTILEITQDGLDSEERKTHSESNWKMVLESLKNMLYKQSVVS